MLRPIALLAAAFVLAPAADTSVGRLAEDSPRG